MFTAIDYKMIKQSTTCIIIIYLWDIDQKVSEKTIQERMQNHKRECLRYSDPFRPESAALATKPLSFGSEVVYLHGKQHTAAVCVPHKVGSHAWGKFSGMFNKLRYLSTERQKEYLNLDFESRASQSVRVVVVRHPLDRLLSVYRMIFEDW